MRSFPGHTGGDSIVVVPDAKVAFLGDLFWRNMLPTLIDASTKPWVETLDAITAMNEPGYTFVPGHGDIGDVKDVAAFRNYLTTLRTLVSEARAQGKAGDALAQSIVPRLKEKFGQWEFAEPVAKNNILETDAEMSGREFQASDRAFTVVGERSDAVRASWRMILMKRDFQVDDRDEGDLPTSGILRFAWR